VEDSSLRTSVTLPRNALGEIVMEVFVDFGLFEILVISGLAALGRALYGRPVTKWLIGFLSIAAPGVLIVLLSDQGVRWIAALALGTSVINISFIAGIARAPTVSNG
jgi:hypothetical protein